MTDHGTTQGKAAGELAADYIRKFKDGYYADSVPQNIKFISSPFIRTLQTCSHFSEALRKKFGDETPGSITINNNIVVTLNSASYRCFAEGVLKRDGQSKDLSDWLYNTSSLELDKNAAQLFKADGTYKDSNKTERYVKGFSDIAQRYAQAIESRSVLVCLSHSDGINEFLSAFK